MARKPRVQFPGAIYHVVTRGDGRRTVFHDQSHYQRLTDGLAAEVVRSGWLVVAFCWMPNHIHLLVKTPEPNLSFGMQHWLSGYANWYAKRNQRSGHLFQGRYKSYLVEDETYFWSLSRYIHLNPRTGKRPLVEKPELWANSSYRGYTSKLQQNDFVAYNLLWGTWRAEYGGSSANHAYRKFVRQGLKDGVDNPLHKALDKMVIGSQEFLKRMIRLAETQSSKQPGSLIRRSRACSVAEIMQWVADEHCVKPTEYVGFRSSAAGRDIAAYLCRQLTPATLADLSHAFGLRHPDSSANLIRRVKKQMQQSAACHQNVEAIKQRLLKTENQV